MKTHSSVPVYCELTVVVSVLPNTAAEIRTRVNPPPSMRLLCLLEELAANREDYAIGNQIFFVPYWEYTNSQNSQMPWSLYCVRGNAWRNEAE